MRELLIETSAHGELLRTLRWSCNCCEVRDRDRDARELRSVAPLLADGELIGPVTLVRNAGRVIGATDAELLRPCVGAELTVLVMLDGSQTVAVGHWGLSRREELGLVELAGPIDTGLDVRPLDLASVSANVEPRGASAALIGIVRTRTGFARSFVPVHVDKDEGPGMADKAPRLASPIEDGHVGMTVDGAPLFAWFPPNPALGRASEVLVLGLAQAYRGFNKPREHPVLAHIVGLDDLGRALLVAQRSEEREPELQQVAGEIEDRGPPAARPSPSKKR